MVKIHLGVGENDEFIEILIKNLRTIPCLECVGGILKCNASAETEAK